MKVLRILGLVFGILLLLAGGGLLLGAAAADQGQSSVQQEIAQQGLKGPVKATVVRAGGSAYTVKFTADDGKSHTATAGSTLSSPPKVGDKVSIFYKADDPSVAVISDAPVNALGGVAGTLRTAGIVTLVIGGLLLVAAILGFVLASKKPQPVAAQPYPPVGSSSAPVPGGYPAQAGYSSQLQTYPGQSQSYPTPPPYRPGPPQN